MLYDWKTQSAAREQRGIDESRLSEMLRSGTPDLATIFAWRFCACGYAGEIISRGIEQI
jgi:hypothetical protein